MATEPVTANPPLSAGPPLSALQLELDHPNLPYRPGDTIKGKVAITNDNVACEFIQVSLVGVSMLMLQNKEGNVMWQYSAMLMSRDHNLTLPSSRQAAFEMRIPIKTEETKNFFAKPIERSLRAVGKAFAGGTFIHRIDLLERQAKVKDRKTLERFATQVGHPLPPTLPPSVNQGSNETTFVPYIEYVVVAKIMEKNASNEIVPTHVEAVPFWMTANPPSPDVMPSPSDVQDMSHFHRKFEVRTNLLRRETPSLKYTLKRAVTFAGLPRFAFEVKVSIPTTAHVGSPIPIQFEVKPDSISAAQTEISPPDLTIHPRIIKIERQTLVWSEAGKTQQFHKGVSFSNFKDMSNPVVFQWSGSGYTGPRFEIGSSFLTQGVIPDFKTYNISVTNKLKLDLVFKCAWESQSFSFDVPIKIASRQRNPSDPGETIGFVDGPQDTSENWGSCARPMAGLDDKDLLAAFLLIEGGKFALDLTSNILDLVTSF